MAVQIWSNLYLFPFIFHSFPTTCSQMQLRMSTGGASKSWGRRVSITRMLTDVINGHSGLWWRDVRTGTLPETTCLHLQMNGWNTTVVSLWDALFSFGEINSSEPVVTVSQHHHPPPLQIFGENGLHFGEWTAYFMGLFFWLGDTLQVQVWYVDTGGSLWSFLRPEANFQLYYL